VDRADILTAMDTLKLYGMKGAFDAVIAASGSLAQWLFRDRRTTTSKTQIASLPTICGAEHTSRICPSFRWAQKLWFSTSLSES
jgi:hypothetical protein